MFTGSCQRCGDLDHRRIGTLADARAGSNSTIVLAVAGRVLRRPSWDRSNLNIVRNVILATVVEKSGHSILVFICNTCKNTCASRAAASSSNGHIDCDCAPCCAPTRGIQSAMTGDLVSHSTPCVISFGWVAYRGRN